MVATEIEMPAAIPFPVPAGIDPKIAERFWANVDRPDDWETDDRGRGLCWTWKRSCNSNGAPQFSVANGVTLNGVRVAWELSGCGSTLGFRIVNARDLCGNDLCVRPLHQRAEPSKPGPRMPRGVFVELLPPGTDPLEAILGGKRAEALAHRSDQRSALLNGTREKIPIDFDEPLTDAGAPPYVPPPAVELPPLEVRVRATAARLPVPSALAVPATMDIAITTIVVGEHWAIVCGSPTGAVHTVHREAEDGRELFTALDNLAARMRRTG